MPVFVKASRRAKAYVRGTSVRKKMGFVVSSSSTLGHSRSKVFSTKSGANQFHAWLKRGSRDPHSMHVLKELHTVKAYYGKG